MECKSSSPLFLARSFRETLKPQHTGDPSPPSPSKPSTSESDADDVAASIVLRSEPPPSPEVPELPPDPQIQTTAPPPERDASLQLEIVVTVTTLRRRDESRRRSPHCSESPPHYHRRRDIRASLWISWRAFFRERTEEAKRLTPVL
ncbi:hypothetical protein E2542_SST26341 [Spatholobus suberectus]|nr:hypothetical protein E2542_SST26341 [Spatholobus suberectus]